MSLRNSGVQKVSTETHPGHTRALLDQALRHKKSARLSSIDPPQEDADADRIFDKGLLTVASKNEPIALGADDVFQVNLWPIENKQERLEGARL